MMNLLIVDDEPVICEGLQKTIAWEDIGVAVVGIASNGREAIEIIKEHPIDIVLTDVSMPEMDGLALAEYLSDEHDHINIIMFSGYDEFEYARQSFRLGVEDYLLKPVNIDELIALVSRIKQDKDMQQSRQHDHTQDSNPTIAHWIRHVIFQKNVDQTSFPTWVHDYHFRVLVTEMTDYYLSSEDSQSDWKSLWTAYLESSPSLTHTESFIVENHLNELITVFFEKSSNTADNDAIKQLCQDFDNNNVAKLKHGLSSCASGLSHIHYQYQKARDILDHIRHDNKLVEIFHQQAEPKILQIPNNTVLQLQIAILNGDKQTLSETSTQLFEYFQKEALSVNNVFKSLREMEIILLSNIDDLMKKRSKLTLQLQGEPDLKIYNSYQAMEYLLLIDLNVLVSERNQPNKRNWIIHQALQYMETHYQKDIKAQQVAEDHFITPNHFSVLFKQETGKSFSECLNAIRINKASDLLLTTSNRVFEIAEFVGYSEYKYFVKVFKNHKGVTPTHFRALHADTIEN
ncbi:response regulator transcription factor [Salipaludibacillus sp. HK11]|uniref:response regulator transcription factor n=1 Tax=Salipaludibacillus sp. HK11 TaxID=3394320 RepID=UPI0039FD6846